MQMQDCVFCKIARKEIPKEFIYEDEEIMVFPDLTPLKPIHLLIIPKRHISEFLAVDDTVLFSKLGQVIQNMIKRYELVNKGYKVVTNGGGAQEINHLHIHLLGPIPRKTVQ